MEAQAGRRWVTLDGATTDVAGAWTTVVTPSAATLLRARFDGAYGLGPSEPAAAASRASRRAALADYSPRSARPPRGRARPGVPGEAVVYQVLQQRIAGRYRRVGVRVVAVRKGRFRGSFTPSFTGRYRVYVAAKADSVTDRGHRVCA